MEWPWKFFSFNAQEGWPLSSGPKEHVEPKNRPGEYIMELFAFL